MNDTTIHVIACRKADDEAFRLYGTDSISCYHVLWPRWLKLYEKYKDEIARERRDAWKKEHKNTEEPSI